MLWPDFRPATLQGTRIRAPYFFIVVLTRRIARIGSSNRLRVDSQLVIVSIPPARLFRRPGKLFRYSLNLFRFPIGVRKIRHQRDHHPAFGIENQL